MIETGKEYRGILLSVVAGLTGFLLAEWIPSSPGSILMALLIGMLIGNFFRIPEQFNSGISFTSGKLLELSILFLAFSINYTHITRLGASNFIIIIVMVVIMVLITYYISNKVKCPGSTGWLVGFGTAICGSSAIAALAPSVAKNKEDVGIAMAVVNLFGSIGMIALPFLMMKLDLDVMQMGMLLGGTLHSVGNVAGSGYLISDEVGEAAITIKLARVAMLSPALIFFNYLVNKEKVNHWKEHFRLPWYLWGFIIITVFTSVVPFPDSFLGFMDQAGKIILTIAMAAIGLKVSFRKLFESGRRGVGFGLMAFLIQIAIVGGLMYLAA
jgi:uncharacterized integral membrane protein (TIGR00698 family)